MKVRITKCDTALWWYANKIGEIYEVKEDNDVRYQVLHEPSYIQKEDCEIVIGSCDTCNYADKHIIKCPAVIDNPMSAAPENCEHWKAIADNECGDIIDRVAQLEAENTRLKEQLKTALLLMESHSKDYKEIEEKYYIIRELVGALNLGDRDKFDATETAILRLKKDRDDAKKELETIKTADEKNKATHDKVIAILSSVIPRNPISDSFHRSFGTSSKIEQFATDCRDMINDMITETGRLHQRIDVLCRREDALIEAMVGLNTSLTQARNNTGMQSGQIDDSYYRGARI